MIDTAPEFESAVLQRVAREVSGDPTIRVRACVATPITSGTSRSDVHRVVLDVESVSGGGQVSVFHKIYRNITKDGTLRAATDPIWKREVLLYESDLLGGVETGLRAARCLDIDWASPTECGLWLEDVGDLWSENWSIERYGLAARHLGQFNGHYVVENKVPDADFLFRDQWHRYLEWCGDGLERLEAHRTDPRVLAVYSEDTTTALLHLWSRREQLVSEVHASVPLSLGHGDTSGRNLYDAPQYPQQTVAIDWECVGLATLADDPARLLGSSIHWFFRGRMDEAGYLADSILTGYLEGLRDVGWDGDAAAVEQAFLAIAATIYGFSYTGFVGQILGEETEEYGRRAYGCTGEQVECHRREMEQFFSDIGTRYLTHPGKDRPRIGK